MTPMIVTQGTFMIVRSTRPQDVVPLLPLHIFQITPHRPQGGEIGINIILSYDIVPSF